MQSCCVVCDYPFKEGDMLQAYLRCKEEPEGSWSRPVEVDEGFQSRVRDAVKRKHASCHPIWRNTNASI